MHLVFKILNTVLSFKVLKCTWFEKCKLHAFMYVF